MDIEFVDPAEAPLPPDQVSFRDLRVAPYPDRQRVKVEMSVTPFQVRPSIDLEVLDAQGARVATASIVEATDTTMSLTLHLKNPPWNAPLVLHARLIYPQIGEVDKRQVPFEPPEADEDI